MAYSELIKNFSKIRDYMKEFYIYGFKTREEFDEKSARSYDNERRRIESYLGEYVCFRQTQAGKNVYISMDGTENTHNPLYKAFKSKSFTDKDITLHFIILDILADGKYYTLKELLKNIDNDYLYNFQEPMCFDESTLRKKLKEYIQLGIIESKKEGRQVLYKIVEDELDISEYKEAIRFFSEENMLGVVGSYLEDKMEQEKEYLSFKNHYIMNAYDTEIIEKILQGIYERRQLMIANQSRRNKVMSEWKVVPLKLYVSTQGGRNYLICSNMYGKQMSFRIDYIKSVQLGEIIENYDSYLRDYQNRVKHMWGVVCDKGKNYEHIEIDINVEQGEDYIVKRLSREKRCGNIEKIDDNTYRFTADVYDSNEMITWIRTFIGRIKKIKCDNSEVVNQLKFDIVKMAKWYEVM